MERAERVRNWLTSILSDPEGLESTGAGVDAVRAEIHRMREWSAGSEEREAAVSAVEGLVGGGNVTTEDLDGLEAIILPRYRPVIDVINADYGNPPAPWERLAEPTTKMKIKAGLRSIGRIEVPHHQSLPYGGTGFVVGDGLLMTNRHVALLFARGLGVRDLAFLPGQVAEVDFAREIVPSDPVPLRVDDVAMIHPYWDMALLKVKGDLSKSPPLQLDPVNPEDLSGDGVAVVGYPGQDQRNDAELQNRIFRGVYQVKRLQPGQVTGRRKTMSYGREVHALGHDASTLGGNSGSCVIALATGHVVGLHFAGRYLESNYAVPAWELAMDPRVVDAGVRFARPASTDSPNWLDHWTEADG